MCSFDIRRKGANQRQSSSTSFTNLCEKSLACKLSRHPGVLRQNQNQIFASCDQNKYISDKKQPKRLILHQVTTLKQDQMIMWCAVGMADTGQKQNY